MKLQRSIQLWIVTALIAFCVGWLISEAHSEEIEDLGIVSSRRSIVLETTNRAEVALFRIGLIALRWPSNHFNFDTTNEILSLEQFAAMPPGPILFGVRYVRTDGEESPLQMYRLSVKRGTPHRLRAKGVAVPGWESGRRKKLEDVLQEKKSREMPAPPAPPGQTDTNANRSFIGPILPGLAQTYSEAVEEMQEFHAWRAAKVDTKSPVGRTQVIPNSEVPTYLDESEAPLAPDAARSMLKFLTTPVPKKGE